MNPTQLDYWKVPGIDIRLNPRVTLDTTGLAEFIRDEMGIDSAIVLATSGTTGLGPKFVVLEKKAMLASARAVNEHLGLTKDDRWLAALTLFHVGGLGIFARACLLGNRVVPVADPLAWDKTGGEFLKAVRYHDITVTALTPVHLQDIIATSAIAPPSLRGVLIGGGAMTQPLAKRAIDLGWPLWPTYGMTETCTQVATGVTDRSALSGWAPILPNWEVRVQNNVCSVRGDALFSGYVTRDDSGKWNADRPFDAGGWFETEDHIGLQNGDSELIFISRRDDLVKSLGELVSIRKLEDALAHFGIVGVVFPVPDERRGHRFIAVVEGKCAERLEFVNQDLAPYERIDDVIELDELPRTAVGKIAKSELRRLVTNQ